MTRTRVLAIGVLVLAAVARPARAQTLQVTPLQREGQVLVSFALTGGFDDDVRAAIRSGLTTTFTYDIDVRQGLALWVDRTLASAEVTASVRYDNLTRRYQVSRSVNGRLETTPQVTDSEDVVRTLMTSFDKLALFSTTTLEANAEYYLRVRVQTSPRSAWFLWPWGRHHATGRATFTFIP
jgi:hypothetical protein